MEGELSKQAKNHVLFRIYINVGIFRLWISEYELEQQEEVRNQDRVYRELHKMKGFYGQLSELIRNTSNKSFDLGIKIALGSMLNCLVVDTPQTASLVNMTLSAQGLVNHFSL